MSPASRGRPRGLLRRGGPAAVLSGLALLPAVTPAGNLRVIVSNVGSEQGSVVAWVYAGPERWLSDDVYRMQSIAVAGNRVDGTVTLEIDLPPGEYALSVFHDLDGDGKLKRSFIGIPKEPAGLSNNAVPRFGPPKYKDAKFTVGESQTEQRIALD